MDFHVINARGSELLLRVGGDSFTVDRNTPYNASRWNKGMASFAILDAEAVG